MKMNNKTKMEISNTKSKIKHFSASSYDGNFEWLHILLPCSYSCLGQQKTPTELLHYLQH